MENNMLTMIAATLFHSVLPLKMATTSCINQHFSELPAFKALEKEQDVDVVVLTGDNVYFDERPKYDRHHFLFNWPFFTLPASYELENLTQEYDTLLNHRDFPKMNAQWIVTWDDHDFGGNNQGAENPDKESFKTALKYFMQKLNNNESADAVAKNANGVYYVQYMTDENGVQVQIIVLDVRFNRKDDDLLGKEQWQWLEKTLIFGQDKKCDWTVIVTGTTVLLKWSKRQYKLGVEDWNPHRHRLLDLIRNPTRTIILSGDIHRSYVVTHESGVTEFIVSSLSHSVDRVITLLVAPTFDESIKFRTHEYRVNGYGLISLTNESWCFLLKDEKKTHLQLCQHSLPAYGHVSLFPILLFSFLLIMLVAVFLFH